MSIAFVDMVETTIKMLQGWKKGRTENERWWIMDDTGKANKKILLVSLCCLTEHWWGFHLVRWEENWLSIGGGMEGERSAPRGSNYTQTKCRCHTTPFVLLPSILKMHMHLLASLFFLVLVLTLWFLPPVRHPRYPHSIITTSSFRLDCSVMSALSSLTNVLTNSAVLFILYYDSKILFGGWLIQPKIKKTPQRILVSHKSEKKQLQSFNNETTERSTCTVMESFSLLNEKR